MKPLLFALVTSALVTTAPAASAQTPQPSTPPSPEVNGTISFSNDELKRFASANRDVERIRAKSQAALGAAIGDPQRTVAVQQQANQAMVQAVQNAGISMALYNQIVSIARVTPQLDQHIQKLQKALPPVAQ